MDNRTETTPGPQERVDAMIDAQNTRVQQEQDGQQKKLIAGIVVAGIVLLALIVGGIYLLLLPTTDTARIRDIFIIVMAIETLLIGLVLVILIVQIARLINLLQNEIKPILDSTNETVSTLRGTTAFLSDNLAEPVIRLNEISAALSQVGSFIGFARKKPKKKP